MNAQQRKNLLKLANYLESLPRDYKHFDMGDYAQHSGGCVLPMTVDQFAARKPREFLANCGTVACAVGHGPAAGIRLLPEELTSRWGTNSVSWGAYAGRAFAADDCVGERQLFDFLFSGDWSRFDNHHYGAAARIRYFLATGSAFSPSEDSARACASYRKGSRSAKRREIDAHA